MSEVAQFFCKLQVTLKQTPNYDATLSSTDAFSVFWTNEPDNSAGTSNVAWKKYRATEAIFKALWLAQAKWTPDENCLIISSRLRVCAIPQQLNVRFKPAVSGRYASAVTSSRPSQL